MARLVKEWMKAKKWICSSDCECLTITGWKCYAEEHLCNCGWGSAPVPPVPPTPVVTYTVAKEEGTLQTTYTASKLEDNVVVEVYQLDLTYNDQSELEEAAISNWENPKTITTLSDAVTLAESAEEAIADTEKTETAFNDFKTFYNSLD